MSPKHRVLVVDDDQGVREALEAMLSNHGFHVKCASNVDEAKRAIESENFDAILTDLRMGADREAGMKLLSWLKEIVPMTPAIMLTAYGSVETAIEAMKRGAADYVMKPFKNEEIRLVVKKAIQQRDLERQNVAYRKDQAQRGKLENIIGKSKASEALRDIIRQVAQLPSTVAIYGESGSGKELVARSVHQLSPRLEKPFVAVNCGGIPENLLESELFGHKKGSFTGAYENREGLFVVADGGTLFLDEVGEMPPPLQVKLLRVLDNSEVTPIGSHQAVKVDVRIISATNRNLELMAKANGPFREDLFYRLNVIPIHVPPLRERQDDIPLLVQHFVRLHGARMGRPALGLAQEVDQALMAYPWPGNVRELNNAIERAVGLSRGDVIHMSDLPMNIRHYMPLPDEAVTDLPVDGVDLEKLVETLEKRLITQALQKTKYSQLKAAKLLGLTPRSLRYRLQKYELEDL